VCGDADIVFGQSQTSQRQTEQQNAKEAKRREKIRKELTKQNAKVELANQKKAQKAQKMALKHHYDMQTKSTRDRMDRHRKNAGSNYGNQGKSFWGRLFRPNSR
jgi:hypothetical protein